MLSNRSLPTATVIPVLVYPDVRAAVAWLCTVEDLAGHRWQFTQSMRDVDPEEWGGQTVG